MKGTYIGFQSMVVSILDQVFKYRFVGLLSGAPENSQKSAILVIMGQKCDFCLFLSNFQPQISFWVLPVWKSCRYGKFLKIFKLFEFFRKKGLGHPQPTQTCKWNFGKNWNFSIFVKISLAVLGGLWVPQALFLTILEKFENFWKLSIPTGFSYGKYSQRYFGLKFAPK